MKRPKKQNHIDSISNPAQARHAKAGINCPSCGRWKAGGAMLCSECNGELNQTQRNRAAADVEAYIEIVRDLRCQRAARDLGLKVL